MTKKKSVDGYAELTKSVAAGQIDKFYIFHGEERYLLEHSLSQLRQIVCPEGLDGFNYRRFSGVTPDELDDAVNTFPVFAERTLIEIHDCDIFKSEHKERLLEIFSELPEYVCVVFVYGTVQYSPDGRQKINAAIQKLANVVEFTVQEQTKLVKWIARRFEAAGKRITIGDAEYLAFITGGYMSALGGEIEKVAAYASGDTATRADIDAVVTPVLDAVAYKLTDALVRRKYADAYLILDELLRMREPAHKLMYGISMKMRELLYARVCIENGVGTDEFMKMCAIRFPFQAKLLMDTARKTTLQNCRHAVLACADAAYDLNSGAEPEPRLAELIARLAFSRKEAAV